MGGELNNSRTTGVDVRVAGPPRGSLAHDWTKKLPLLPKQSRGLYEALGNAGGLSSAARLCKRLQNLTHFPRVGGLAGFKDRHKRVVVPKRLVLGHGEAFKDGFTGFQVTPETNKYEPPVKCPSELQSLDI